MSDESSFPFDRWIDCMTVLQITLKVSTKYIETTRESSPAHIVSKQPKVIILWQ